MPHRHHTVPGYRFHKRTGQAVVTLSGRDHYLGKHGSPESHAKYQRLIAEYVNHGFRMPELGARAPFLVAHLCDQYRAFAEREYRHPDGTPTGTVENTKLAMRGLFEFAADLPAEEFGPRLLNQLRERMVERGLARATINDRIGIVKRAFKWGAENELLPATAYHALCTVRGLRRGRGGARETDPIRPVPEEHVSKALPLMPEPVQAMVQLQLLTGARPGEIASMRACDIDRRERTWLYRPVLHKNSWRGEDRVIPLGPAAREIVSRWMRPGLQEGFLFSPREAERLRHERARAQRRTPLYPSHIRAQAKRSQARPRAKFGDRYEVDQYRQAIVRACVAAGVPPWHPNQLRHNAATRLREHFGLEVAKVVLGHRLIETTQIYAEADRKRAIEIMEQVG